MNDQEAVILSAVRTPSGKFQGSLAGFPAPKLGSIVIRAAVERAGIPDPGEIDEVIMGNVVSAGLGQAPARQAAIGAGLPVSVGATTINKVCGSGLKAVMLAAQAIKAGDGHLFVAGGFESMSRAPFLVQGRSGELRFGHVQCPAPRWAVVFPGQLEHGRCGRIHRSRIRSHARSHGSLRLRKPSEGHCGHR